MRGGFRQFVFQKSVFLKHPSGQSAMLSMQYSPIASHQLRRLLSSCDGNNNEGKFTSESEIAVILI